MAIIAWFLVVFNLATLVSEFIAGTRARARAGRGVLDAFMSLFARHRRRYGGYVVHIGMVLIFLAFIGNVVKADVDATLAPGQSVELGDYTIRFDGIETIERVDRVEKYANMTLMRNGRVIGDLQPARFDFNDRSNLRDGRPDPMKITSEIRIHSTPVEDLYIAFLQHDEERNAAAFKMVILPFTWWLWFGGVVLIAGTFICMWPDTAPTATRRAAVAGGVEVASVLLTMLVPVLVFGADMKAFAQEPPEHGDEAPPADVIDPALRAHANNLYHQLMTTCEGCAGKTLATASPSCYPSNQDKARITGFLQEGMTEAQILDVFVEERGPTALAVPSGDGALGGLHWMGPVAGILGGIVVVGLVATRWRRDDVGSRPDLTAAVAGAPASPAATVPVDPYLARLRDELSARD
jgi:cytochrome c-type biogenesis protein CcmF